MIALQAMCETHPQREAVGRFRVVHLFNGGMKPYLCASCAQGRTPHDEPAARWVLATNADPNSFARKTAHEILARATATAPAADAGGRDEGRQAP